MSCLEAVAVVVLQHIRGETATFILEDDDPEFIGTEVLTCDVKLALSGYRVPPASAPVLLSIIPVFAPATLTERARWHLPMTALQTASLAAEGYIADARILYPSGAVIQTVPWGIHLFDRVTVTP